MDRLRPDGANDVKICHKIHLNNRICKSCSHFLPPTVFHGKNELELSESSFLSRILPFTQTTREEILGMDIKL